MAIPAYRGMCSVQMIHGLFKASKAHDLRILPPLSTSANCTGMNLLWIAALEQRDSEGLDWFIMHHTDIEVITPFWLDRMVEIAEQNEADVLSVNVPIKDHVGLTSTALDERHHGMHEWRVRRLTTKETAAKGAYWTAPNLLVNTGIMLVNMRRDWVNEMYFHFEDKIVWQNGRRVPVLVPEDWGWSRDARSKGASIWCTNEIVVRHYGEAAFGNDITWGADTDPAMVNPPIPDRISAAIKTASAIKGYMSYEELLWLAQRATAAKVTVEVGSWRGRSTKALSVATNGVVYALDHWNGSVNDATSTQAKEEGNIFEQFKQNCASEIKSGRLKPVNIDHDRPVMIAGEEALTLKDGTIVTRPDFVFIDGGHEYAEVKRDIEHWLPLVKPGGILSGHDYTDLSHPGVKQAVDEIFGDKKKAGNGSIWYVEIPAAATSEPVKADEETKRLESVK